MRIAIVGCGEVGTTYAGALLETGGHDLVLVDPAPRAGLVALAAEHDLTVHAGPGAWLRDVDAAWLCVAGDIAHEVLAEAHSWLPQGARVLDLTTASPDDKRRSAALLAGAGTYVDVVIMGAIAMGGAATPLLAAGPAAADATAELAAIGPPCACCPGPARVTPRRSSCCAASSPRASRPSAWSAWRLPRPSGCASSCPSSSPTSTAGG